MAVLVGRTEAMEAMNMETAIEVLSATLIEQGAGKIEEVPPLRFMNRGMRVVVGGLRSNERRGIRVSVTDSEAIALLFDIQSGHLLAVIGYPFSSLRVGATVGIAVDLLSKEGARSVAMIGSGRNAIWLLKAVKAVRPITQIVVYSPNQTKCAEFAKFAQEELEISVEPVPRVEKALEACEIALVSTNSVDAALKGEWLAPGMAVFSAGRPNELDDKVYLDAHSVVVASKIHEQGYYNSTLDQPLIRLSNEKKISWDHVIELGDVLSGRNSVPRSERSIVVFRESQGGYGDIALASWLYDQLIARGGGIEYSFD